jgi:hypothetical protein
MEVHGMGNEKTDDMDETKLRGRSLEGSDQRTAVDHAEYVKKRNTDTTLRLDGEEDTLYDDGLEIESDSRPLTGKDGRDDTQ